jgi:hypothetical protein
MSRLSRFTRYAAYSFALLVATAACDAGSAARLQAQGTRDSAPAALECRVEEVAQPLPGDVRETSGIVRSRADSTVFWTHNDSGDKAVLYALDERGQLLERVRVSGASALDWEDLAAAPCAGGSCMYIADTGDNEGVRPTIDIYRVIEPARGAGVTAPAARLTLRYPDAPQNAEALFALPDGSVFVVTKGTHGTVSLFALPSPESETGVRTLRLVRELFPHPTDSAQLVTGAAASPDGRWVVIRTYGTLFFYDANALVSNAPVTPLVYDVRPLREAQGEAVALSNDGQVWLTSEGEGKRAVATRTRLQCNLPQGM